VVRMRPSMKPHAPRPKTPLDRLLSLFTDLHGGESPTVLLLALNVSLLLAAYSIIKPVRDALIVSEPGGAESKAYLGAVIAALMVFLVPLYAKLVNRFIRSTLVTAVTLFFVACLVGFWVMNKASVPYLGYTFFVWIAIFNVMVVAQFWGFANDVYDGEAGKRLFPVVAFGANAGAVLGPRIHTAMLEYVNLFDLMLLAAAVLLVCIVLTVIVARREFGSREDPPPSRAGGGIFDGLDLLFKHRYLGLVALLVLLLNVVNTNGEYLFGRLVRQAAQAETEARFGPESAPPSPDGDARKAFMQERSSRHFADLHFWVNLTAAVLQLFFVSRIVKYGGLKPALLMLPLIALGSYALIAALPVLRYVRIAKIGENGTNYSVQKTATQMLFLPTTTAVKYKATQAADSFMQRVGDTGSALVVFLGTEILGFSVSTFALVNVGFIVLWLVVVALLVREHRRVEAGERTELVGERAEPP
jgi:ATP:ADP antiporter, AAA family